MKQAVIKTINKGLSVGHLRYELRVDNKLLAQSVHPFKSIEHCRETLAKNFIEFDIVDATDMEVELVDDTN